MFPGLDLYYTYPPQRVQYDRLASTAVEDLDRGLSDVLNILMLAPHLRSCPLHLTQKRRFDLTLQTRRVVQWSVIRVLQIHCCNTRMVLKRGSHVLEISKSLVIPTHVGQKCYRYRTTLLAWNTPAYFW